MPNVNGLTSNRGFVVNHFQTTETYLSRTIFEELNMHEADEDEYDVYITQFSFEPSSLNINAPVSGNKYFMIFVERVYGDDPTDYIEYKLYIRRTTTIYSIAMQTIIKVQGVEQVIQTSDYVEITPDNTYFVEFKTLVTYDSLENYYIYKANGYVFDDMARSNVVVYKTASYSDTSGDGGPLDNKYDLLYQYRGSYLEVGDSYVFLVGPFVSRSYVVSVFTYTTMGSFDFFQDFVTYDSSCLFPEVALSILRREWSRDFVDAWNDSMPMSGTSGTGSSGSEGDHLTSPLVIDTSSLRTEIAKSFPTITGPSNISLPVPFDGIGDVISDVQTFLSQCVVGLAYQMKYGNDVILKNLDVMVNLVIQSIKTWCENSTNKTALITWAVNNFSGSLFSLGGTAFKTALTTTHINTLPTNISSVAIAYLNNNNSNADHNLLDDLLTSMLDYAENVINKFGAALVDEVI